MSVESSDEASYFRRPFFRRETASALRYLGLGAFLLKQAVDSPIQAEKGMFMFFGLTTTTLGLVQLFFGRNEGNGGNSGGGGRPYHPDDTPPISPPPGDGLAQLDIAEVYDYLDEQRHVAHLEPVSV